MKMNFKHVMLACALVAGFASCSKEDNYLPKEGQATTMKLNIQFPKPGTKTAGDQNATELESKMNTVDVFIFNTATGAVTHKAHLTSGQFSYSGGTGDDVYTGSAKVATTTGAKKIAVGLNLPSTFDVAAVSTMNDLQKQWETSYTNLATGTGIAMFSKDFVSADLVSVDDNSYDTQNKIDVTVERMVAKISVQKSQNLTLTSVAGILSDIKYSVRQVNKLTFPMQVKDANVVKDPNWATGTYNANDLEADANYVAVNAHDAAVLDWKVKYATENTNEKPFEKLNTYVSVQAVFTPAVICDANGDKDDTKTGTFSTGDDFYTVKLNGDVYYFDDQADAEAFNTSVASGSAAVVKYTNGVCYFYSFINEADDFDVLRNKFYNLTVKQIVPPGNNTPEVKNPDDPISTKTDITLDITIEDWDYSNEEIILS
ncbi:MAG: Mfa1 family fimbria major subunit [Bacteroidales bacterium]|jgi:hypothetical protein|nr:Mfa1 family fimbria major subunit [Bacteroidales bacterium]